MNKKKQSTNDYKYDLPKVVDRFFDIENAKFFKSPQTAILLIDFEEVWEFFLENDWEIKIENQKGSWFYYNYDQCEKRTALSEKEFNKSLDSLKKHGIIKTLDNGNGVTAFQIDYKKMIDLGVIK